ncbi:hypothetical protein ACIBO4_28710 [Streptomyces sp. NPDC050149]|uniref:hypothetical protein n=1 Tax=Streptomyces sp. NPDC050149 TaxID=3365603 RepID=UPI0037A23B23
MRVPVPAPVRQRPPRLLAEALAANTLPSDPDSTLLDECRMRWTGVYVVLHTDDKPSHLGIFGYSGD